MMTALIGAFTATGLTCGIIGAVIGGLIVADKLKKKE